MKTIINNNLRNINHNGPVLIKYRVVYDFFNLLRIVTAMNLLGTHKMNRC